jgi:Ca-activated chloride channel homolog
MMTDEEIIGGHAGALDEDGIYMVGVSVGTAATYNDLLMDRVTDLGRGASVFVPSEDEAWWMFGDRFLETLATAARDVQIRYDLPPGFEVVRFSGEEIATDPAEVEPQHVAPNDAVVLHQHLHSCADADSGAAEFTVTVSYLDGVTFEPREVTLTRTLDELLDGDQAELLKGAAVFAYAEALKKARGEESLDDVPGALEALAAAEAANPGDADLAEIRTVLERL